MVEHKIKGIKLKSRVFLAPMFKINDLVFRELCKKCGAGLVWTELISPESKAKLDFSDNPVIQLVCNRINGIKDFIKNNKKAKMFDLNLGCPSRHAGKSGIGYEFTNDLQGVENVLREMKEGCKKVEIPICVKIRKMDWIKTKKIIQIAEKYCDVICLHPRTMKQGYSGEADMGFALKIKKITRLPVIYSGDIVDFESAKNALRKFDFIMIGRKAIGNPGIFSEILGLKNKKEVDFLDYLKLAKKYKIDFSQIKFQAMNFSKGLRGSAKFRKGLERVKDVKELEGLYKKFIDEQS